ncbi:hypothetical protein K438DRAFT_1824025 [Mycena galopus ATCC 62051]|nr:hypothetical protein K438DRAFT_1824025 [Mycena galopus ATCC 62051]
MTYTIPNDYPSGLKMKRTSSSILLFRSKLSTGKDKLNALAPIIELEEPGPGEDRDQGIAQTLYTSSEHQFTAGVGLAIPNALLQLELCYRTLEPDNCPTNYPNQTTPTVEFTSLSLTEEPKCVSVPLRQSRPPPLRAVSNFEHNSANRHNIFAGTLGSTNSTVQSGYDFAVAVCEGVDRRTRKRSRESDVEDERIDVAKRQRRTSSQGPSTISICEIPVSCAAKESPTVMDCNVHLPSPRGTLFLEEKIPRPKRKRSHEQVNQAAEVADARYTKRRRVGGST